MIRPCDVSDGAAPRSDCARERITRVGPGGIVSIQNMRSFNTVLQIVDSFGSHERKAIGLETKHFIDSEPFRTSDIHNHPDCLMIFVYVR